MESDGQLWLHQSTTFLYNLHRGNPQMPEIDICTYISESKTARAEEVDCFVSLRDFPTLGNIFDRVTTLSGETHGRVAAMKSNIEMLELFVKILQ